jgi:hypothetical protein
MICNLKVNDEWQYGYRLRGLLDLERRRSDFSFLTIFSRDLDRLSFLMTRSVDLERLSFLISKSVDLDRFLEKIFILV